MSNIPINNYKPLRQTTSSDAMDKKLRDVSQLYEKQFLREMVKSMRGTVDHGGLTEPSMGENIFKEKLDHEYVEKWGDSGGIGLADVIYGQLKERFNPSGPMLLPPEGPLPLEKGGTMFKVDETKPFGFPVVPTQKQETGKDMTYQIKVDGPREVLSPWSGRVAQSFSGPDERQTIKVQHDNGLVSTLVFSGRSETIKSGDTVTAGQKLGQVSPDHENVTWQLLEVLKTT